MKLFLATLFILCAVGATAAEPNLPATRYVIGLSPFLEREEKDEVFRAILQLLLQDLPLNSSLWICDAYNLRTIGHAEIPEVRAFRASKTRANQFADQINSLKKFLAREHPQPRAPAGSKLDFQRAIRLPQFLDFIQTPKPDRILLFGSPLYQDPKEPRFSMSDGFFPTDAHLGAKREQTIFGLKERSATFENSLVYLGYFGDPWISDLHQEKISRFWKLYIQTLGGRLATFTADLPTVFSSARAAQSSGPGAQLTLDSVNGKVEMLRVTRDISTDDWITSDSIPRRNIGPPAKTVGPMKIGIRWSGDIDLDLYALPRPGGETLYFERTRTAAGYYFKDHRSSPEREYEFIEFEAPVDVWQVEAMINFYDGQAVDGVSGEVRVEFEDKIYSTAFAIPATIGNKGRSGPSQREHWAKINLPQLLRLDGLVQIQP